VWRLRADGVPAYVTIDAGPQVKVLCEPAASAAVAAALTEVAGVQRVMTCRPGAGARIVS
jgi:diphosphomevalonate decarboxylase